LETRAQRAALAAEVKALSTIAGRLHRLGVSHKTSR
jgi:hypothetical protein